MATVRIADVSKPVAVGLDWHPLRGVTSSRKEVAELVKEHGAKIGCIYTERATGGTILGLTAEPVLGRICGAATLASAVGSENVLLIEPADGNRVWVCAVRAGLPSPGMDRLVGIEELPEFIASIGEYLADSLVCSTLEDLENYGVGASIKRQSFAELVVSTKPVLVSRVHGVSPTMVAGLFLGVLAVASGLAYVNWEEAQKRSRAQQALAEISERQRAAEQAELERLRREAEERVRAEVSAAVLAKPSVLDSVGAVMNLVEALPRQLAGWEVKEFDCSATQCSVMWARREGATALDFMSAAVARQWQAQVNGSTALSSHPVVSTPREPDFDKLEEQAPFELALESRLQQAEVIGIKYEMTRAKPHQVDPVATSSSAAPPAPEAAPAASLYTGSALVQGTKLFEIREIPSFVDHPGLALRYIKGAITEQTWKMEIDYATK